MCQEFNKRFGGGREVRRWSSMTPCRTTNPLAAYLDFFLVIYKKDIYTSVIFIILFISSPNSETSVFAESILTRAQGRPSAAARVRRPMARRRGG